MFRGYRLFALLVVAALLSSGWGYVLELALAGRPADFTRNFVGARWLADGKPLTALDGAAGNALAVRAGAEPVPMPCGPYYLNPPGAAAPLRALAALSYRWAALAWMLLSVAAAGALGSILTALWRRSPSLPAPGAAAASFVAVVLWPPAVMNIGFGQSSLPLAALVAAGWWSLECGRPRSAAGALGAAAALKLTPALLGGYLLLRRRRVLAAALAVAAALTAAGWPLGGGLDGWRAFLRDGHADALCWEAYPDNTVSLTGVLARLFVGGPFVRPALAAPGPGHALGAAASLALVAVAALATWRRPRGACAADDGPAFAMWAALMPLVSPLGWTHQALFFLLPAVLLARPPAPTASRRAVAAALVMLTVPRGTLFLLAAPVPFSPTRSWILGLHALGGVILFACAVARALAAPAPAAPSKRADGVEGPTVI